MVLQIKVLDGPNLEQRVNEYCKRHQNVKELHFPKDEVCVAVFDIPENRLQYAHDLDE